MNKELEPIDYSWETESDEDTENEYNSDPEPVEDDEYSDEEYQN